MAAAENAKAGVAVGAQADIAAGLPYVSQAAMDALESAIAAAQARRNDAAATQAEVNTAVQTLASAVAAFTTTIKTDGTKTSGFTAEDIVWTRLPQA